MKLDRVTMTGADDSVNPTDLAELSHEFPFVEWGILFSRNNQGSPRWPSGEWLNRLAKEYADGYMMLSAHVCGGWIRDILLGGDEFFRATKGTLADYSRVQLNFHGEPLNADPTALAFVLLKHSDLPGIVPRQFIFQMDGRNNGLMDSVRQNASIFNIAPLFDMSHGAGLLPGEWPKATYRDIFHPSTRFDAHHPTSPILYHGYAGGIGPDTIASQLPKIAEAAGDARIWIDMETRIRSDNDRQFDLGKVRSVLEYCRPFIDA